jgi:hypothetical protein
MSGAKLPPHRSALRIGAARRHRWHGWRGLRGGGINSRPCRLAHDLGRANKGQTARGNIQADLGQAQVRPSEPRSPSSVHGSGGIAESPMLPRMLPLVPLILLAAASAASQLGSFSTSSATKPWPMQNPVQPRRSLQGRRRSRRARPALLGMIWWRSWDSSPMSSPASSSRIMAPRT